MWSCVLANYQVCLTHCKLTCIVLLVTATREVPSTSLCHRLLGLSYDTVLVHHFAYSIAEAMQHISVKFDTDSL
jgi:hypothetical protein